MSPISEGEGKTIGNGNSATGGVTSNKENDGIKPQSLHSLGGSRGTTVANDGNDSSATSGSSNGDKQWQWLTGSENGRSNQGKLKEDYLLEDVDEEEEEEDLDEMVDQLFEHRSSLGGNSTTAHSSTVDMSTNSRSQRGAGRTTSINSKDPIGGRRATTRRTASVIAQSILRRNRDGRFELDASCRNINYDDEEGHQKFFLLLLYESIEDAGKFFFGSILIILVWSIVCAWGSQRLHEHAEANPGGAAERWVDNITDCRHALAIVGSLFVFTLVFRFNACYDRWWEARIFWGDIVTHCLDVATMNRSWIADEDLADRMSRFIIVFAYASKALLRGKSLNEEGEDGPALVKRGLLTKKELEDMHFNPCWQPHYCLQMIREVIFEAHNKPGCLKFETDNKAYGQLFRCYDNTLKEMYKSIGDCVRVRSSGLPASYDALVMLSYFAFFFIASVVWGVGIRWMAPIIIFAASLVIMFLIVMGTKLVDPFGYDKVDAPLDAFCATIEAQVYAIDKRSKDGSITKLAKHSSTTRLSLDKRKTEYMCGIHKSMTYQ